MPYVRLLQALDFAAEKHRAQRRKNAGDIPYINHPIRAARLLADIGGVEDEEVLAAAVLHDVVEDTATTPEEIEATFGPRVRGLVDEATDDKSLPKMERKRLQIVTAPHKSPGGALVKLADKIANVGDFRQATPVGWPIDRVRAYLAWAEEVVQALPKVNAPLEAEFAKVLAEAREAVERRECSRVPVSSPGTH